MAVFCGFVRITERVAGFDLRHTTCSDKSPTSRMFHHFITGSLSIAKFRTYIHSTHSYSTIHRNHSGSTASPSALVKGKESTPIFFSSLTISRASAALS